MKFKKTMTILFIALVVASFAATAVSTIHIDGRSSDSYIARGVKANPGASFYISLYYLISVFQYLVHQPFIIRLVIYLYLIGIKIYLI